MVFNLLKAATIALVSLVLGLPLAAATFEEVSASASAARIANDVPRAIDLYRQAVQMNQQWKEGWWYLGSLLYDTDQYAPARDALAQLVKLEPRATPAWGLLGLSEFQTGDYPAALAHVQRSLASGGVQGQMDAVLRYHEALLLTRAGQFDTATQKYAAVARSAAPNPPLLAGIGLAALERAQLPNEIQPGDQDVVMAAGKVAFSILAQDYAKAGEGFADLLTRFPNSPGVHLLYGSYLLANAPEHAIDEFKKELNIAPSDARAAAMLAWALLNRREAVSALPYAKTAATAAPGSATAQYAFGRALAENGDVESGIEHLKTADKLNPSNLETHLALASAYSKAGRTELARQERARAMELAGRNAVVAQ